MKKIIIGILTILFFSCGVDHTDFSGDWIDKKNESDRMVIIKNGDNYIVENRGKKYPAQITDGLLEISTELPIKATIDENDILIVAGEEYIRFEKATKPKFLGKWKESYSINPKTDEKMEFSAPGTITISDNNGRLKIDYDGHPQFPQQYQNLRYDNGIIKYDLRHRDETGKWNYNKEMSFTLLDDKKLKTKSHISYTDEDIIFVKE